MGEAEAFPGTTSLLQSMMTQPDRDEPDLKLVSGATGLGLVMAGWFHMLSGADQADGRRSGAVNE